MLLLKTALFVAFLAFVTSKPAKHCEGEDDPNIVAKAKTCPEPGSLIDDIKHGDEQGLHEGDIVLRPGETKDNRNMAKLESYKWPRSMDGKVYIPYDDSLLNDKVKGAFQAGVKNYDEVSCIRFIPRTDEVDYVELTEEGGCYSAVGRWSGKQPLNLSPRCADFHGIVLHEMLHTVGFMHEHTRQDRDDYITINWGNLCTNCEGNYIKASKDYFDTFGTAYDYGSVMHYDEYTGSRNGNPVIVTKTGENVGQRIGFSKHDIEKLNMLYHCHEDPTTPPPTTTTTTTRRTTTSTTTRSTTKSVPTTPGKCPNLKPGSYCDDWLNYVGSLDKFCNDAYWQATAAFCPGTCDRCEGTTPATTTEGTTKPTTAEATTEPTTTQEVTTEGATTEQVTTEGATTEQVTTEGATTEQVTTEGATTEQVTTEGATTEQVTTERATTAGSCADRSGTYCHDWSNYAGNLDYFCNSGEWEETAAFCPKTCGKC